MPDNHRNNLRQRVTELEQQWKKKQSRPFLAAVALALIPIAFGLYQFYLSNFYRAAENETSATLAALEGDTASEICGNLSLLLEANLLTGHRKSAVEALIKKLKREDEIDGGIEFECLPRISPGSSSELSSLEINQISPVLENPEAFGACSTTKVELKYSAKHNLETIEKIEKQLLLEKINFVPVGVSANEEEIKNYSGLVWYYYPEDRRCAEQLVDSLTPLGIDLATKYYTRSGLPQGLPVRIWPRP